MAARPTSACGPRSPALLLDPTLTYSRLPSGLASRFFVQWWLIGPPGRSTSLVPGAVITVSPLRYGKLSTASAFAT